jgi:hypothetical protein
LEKNIKEVKKIIPKSINSDYLSNRIGGRGIHTSALQTLRGLSSGGGIHKAQSGENL